MDFIPSLKKYKNLKIKKYETWYNEENADLLKKVLEAYSINRIGVPATIIGDTIIMGFGEGTGNRIERAIEYYSNHPYIDQVSRIQKGTFKNEEFNPDNDFMKEEKEK